MADWKDNKYGHEAGYSALEEAEGFKWTGLFLALSLAVVAIVGGLLWWLLAA